jgi:pimeloyl-ACP methyl ester carboxylesterase
MSSKSQWRKLVDSLRNTHRLIAIDLHGYGETGWPRSAHDFGLDDEVKLVESVLARHAPAGECFHLVGHSYGGAVALQLALAAPDRVRSLSLFEPGAFHLLPHDERVRADLEALRSDVHTSLAKNDAHRGAARFIDFWNGDGAFAGLSSRRQASLTQLLPKTALDFQAVARACPNIAAYRRLRAPACLIGGRHSPQVARTVLSVLGEMLPRAACHHIAAGHMAPVTHPELVNPLIADFVRAFDSNTQSKAA